MQAKQSLGPVYTMDHEVVQGRNKSIDWMLSLSWDHFGLHQENNGKVTMEVKVPKQHILRRDSYIDMVQWDLR